MKLYLPHRNLSIQNLDTEISPWVALAEMEDWEKSLFLFIQEWANDSRFVKAQTSGSTGIPKKIQLKKEFMINSALKTIEFFELSQNDSALLCLSTDFIAGKMMVVRAIQADLNLICVSPSSSPLKRNDIEIDFAAMVPLQAQNSLPQLNSVKKLIVGGGAISNNLEQDLQTTNCQVWSTYGMTETITHVALKKINGEGASSFFKTLTGVTILQDDRSCLIIDAPHLSNERVITNDVIEITSPNTFKWLGRWDNIINSGGVKINPEELETLFSNYISRPFIISSIPDNVLENKLILMIEDNTWKKESVDQLLNQLKKVTSKYKVPKEVFFLPQFVVTKNGKVQRKKTLDLLLSQQ